MPRRIRYVKLVHDILPTHSRQNCMDKGKRVCPCCSSLNKDRDHVLRCPTAARNQWRHQFLDKLSETCETHHTYAPFRQLLLEGFRQWLDPDNSPLDQVQIATYTNELHPLIHAQNSIGWRQLFNGRFSQKWGDIQNDHLFRNRQHLPTTKSSGQKWQVAIITAIWEQWYLVWRLRNDDVHGKDVAARALAEKREIQSSRRLTAIYDQRNHMEPSAQFLLFSEIQHHLEQPPWVIQNWITINGPVFMATGSLRTVKAKAIQTSDPSERISPPGKTPPGTYMYTVTYVGRAPSGVVSNRAGRVSPIIGTAAARKCMLANISITSQKSNGKLSIQLR